jgi:hypothetical protein
MAVASSTFLVLPLLMLTVLHPLLGIGILVVIKGEANLVIHVVQMIWTLGATGTTARQQSLLFLLSEVWVVAKSNTNETSEGGTSPCTAYGACLLVPTTQCSNNDACKCVSQNIAI